MWAKLIACCGLRGCVRGFGSPVSPRAGIINGGAERSSGTRRDTKRQTRRAWRRPVGCNLLLKLLSRAQLGVVGSARDFQGCWSGIAPQCLPILALLIASLTDLLSPSALCSLLQAVAVVPVSTLTPLPFSLRPAYSTPSSSPRHPLHSVLTSLHLVIDISSPFSSPRQQFDYIGAWFRQTFYLR